MSSKTILCVDDSPTQLRSMLEALEGSGYQILTATSGDEALEKVAETTPDLVLLDVVLPGRSGYQVCRELKNMPGTRDIKVVLVSSKSQDFDLYWGMRQGADAYLTKPFEADQLRSRVAEQLSSIGRRV